MKRFYEEKQKQRQNRYSSRILIGIVSVDEFKEELTSLKFTCACSRADKDPREGGNTTECLGGSWSHYNLSASPQLRRVVIKQ